MDKPPSPWTFDGIGPGEDWDTVLRQRLRQADLILLFLSNASIGKRGYVQREYRLALDLAAEQPAGSVLLIPILLERCELPDLKVGPISLRQIQRFPLFEVGLQPLLDYVAELVEPTPADLPKQRFTARQATVGSDAQPYKIALQRTLVDLFGLQELPPNKAAEMINRLAKLVFQAVLIRLFPILSEANLAEYERIVDSAEGGDRLLLFFAEIVPDFNDILMEEAELLRVELAGELDAAEL